MMALTVSRLAIAGVASIRRDVESAAAPLLDGSYTAEIYK